MPNKIGTPRDFYFNVQEIHRGWALFGVVEFTATGANLAHAILVRSCRRAFWTMLHVRWEYSHAANAVATLLALCSASASVLASSRP